MARFLYKGKDLTGKVRSGTLEAANYAEARSALQAQGIEVSMLNQAAEPRLVESIAPTTLPDLEPEKPRRKFILPVIFLVGMVALGVWLLPRLQLKPNPGKAVLKPGEQTRQISLRGQVELLGLPSGAVPEQLLKDVRVTAIFPDVPTEITLYYPDLHMTGSGAFDCKLYFLSVIEPKEANVSIRLSGFESLRLTNLVLKKVEDRYELDVPRATMKTRKGFVPTPGEFIPTGPDEDESSED